MPTHVKNGNYEYVEQGLFTRIRNKRKSGSHIIFPEYILIKLGKCNVLPKNMDLHPNTELIIESDDYIKIKKISMIICNKIHVITKNHPQSAMDIVGSELYGFVEDGAISSLIYDNDASVFLDDIGDDRVLTESSTNGCSQYIYKLQIEDINDWKRLCR